MPSSVERALADSFSLEHPDVPWAPPEVPPPTSDLRAALQILEAQMAPATPRHAAWCLAKLMMAFEPSTKLSAEETKLRAAVWLEANGDLGDELWSNATLAAIQTSKWMPKPAEFRKLVEREFDDRVKRLQRCRAMLGGTRETPADQPFVREPEDVRLRTLRDSLRRVGQVSRAAVYERQIAAKEGREPEPWAVGAHQPEAVAAPEVAAIKPSPASVAALRRANARWARAEGRAAYAEQLEREADALAPEDAPEDRYGDAA